MPEYHYTEDLTLQKFYKKAVEIWNIDAIYAGRMTSIKARAFRENGYIQDRTVTELGESAGLRNVTLTKENGDTFVTYLISRSMQEELFNEIPSFKENLDRHDERTGNVAYELRKTGIFNGEEVYFGNAVYKRHNFTSDEMRRLYNGETITITCQNYDGFEYTATGSLVYTGEIVDGKKKVRFFAPANDGTRTNLNKKKPSQD